MAEGGLKRSVATAAEDAATMDGKVRASSSSEVAPAKRVRVSDRDANAAAGALAKRALLTTDRLHQLLGPGWTAVLLETCGVSAAGHSAFLPKGEELRLRLKDFSSKKIIILPRPGQEGRATHGGIIEGAAERGSVSMVKWLRERACPWSKNTTNVAAKLGHLGVLKYLHENGCSWDEGTCTSAAEGGHLHVLRQGVPLVNAHPAFACNTGKPTQRR